MACSLGRVGQPAQACTSTARLAKAMPLITARAPTASIDQWTRSVGINGRVQSVKGTSTGRKLVSRSKTATRVVAVVARDDTTTQSGAFVRLTAFQRASVHVSQTPGYTLEDFLKSEDAHGALMDSPNRNLVGEGTYSLPGAPISVLWYTIVPYLTVAIRHSSDGLPALSLGVVDAELKGMPVDHALDISSANVLTWRTVETDDNDTEVQLKSEASVQVIFGMPSWIPASSSVLSSAGSKALQIMLDSSVPGFLERLSEAYTAWARMQTLPPDPAAGLPTASPSSEPAAASAELAPSGEAGGGSATLHGADPSVAPILAVMAPSLSFVAATQGLMRFSASRALSVPIRQTLDPDTGLAAVALQEYLASPARLVRVLFGGPEAVQALEEPDAWRVRLPSVTVLQWSVTPLFDLHLAFDQAHQTLSARSGTVALCPQGLPSVFEGMELVMRMEATSQVAEGAGAASAASIVSEVELEIAMDLPGMLMMVPGIQSMGNRILDTILASIESTAQSRLQEDYCQFVDEQVAGSEVAVSEVPASGGGGWFF